MHGENALLGEQVVHDREHPLLQLARVARAPDEDRSLSQVEDDERAAAGAVSGLIRLEFRRVQNREIGIERW
jgi:hypothetical protein